MSLKSLKERSNAALAGISPGSEAPFERPARPITSPGAAAFMQPTIDALNDRAKAAEARVAELQSRLDDQPGEVALDALLLVDGRQRHLTDDQFDELKANLAQNPLVHPVIVQRLADGRYELVSGHNRVKAYRELGKETIPAVVRAFEEGKVDRSAFYANLLQPSLPDYEKFLGFKRERERTGLNQSEMAAEAGVSKSMVSKLFAFEDLPEPVQTMLGERPEILGMNVAAELAKLAKEGRATQVIEAVQLIAQGTLLQKDAARYAAKVTEKVVKATLTPIKIKRGKQNYCEYVAKGQSLRIEFKSEALRIEAEEAIAALLQSLAKEDN